MAPPGAQHKRRVANPDVSRRKQDQRRRAYLDSSQVPFPLIAAVRSWFGSFGGLFEGWSWWLWLHLYLPLSAIERKGCQGGGDRAQDGNDGSDDVGPIGLPEIDNPTSLPNDHRGSVARNRTRNVVLEHV